MKNARTRPRRKTERPSRPHNDSLAPGHVWRVLLELVKVVHLSEERRDEDR